MKRLFQPQISLGHVLTMLSIIFGAGGAYYGTVLELRYLDRRLSQVETALVKLAEVTVTTARLEGAISILERRINQLETRRSNP